MLRARTLALPCRLPRCAAAPRLRSAPLRGLAAASPSSSSSSISRVAALAGNLHSARDVQDLLISYGGSSAAVPGVVRPLAVVKVGGEVITKDIDNLVASLRFLADFGLTVRRRCGAARRRGAGVARSGAARGRRSRAAWRACEPAGEALTHRMEGV